MFWENSHYHIPKGKKENQLANGPTGTGSVVNRVLAIRLVQWLGWVFETQEWKKESD